MLKKLSIKTNFILIGIVIGFFVGVSIQQTFGDTTTVPGTVQGDNLTVNTGGQYANGLIVANGNALVAGKVGVGTINPSEALTVTGKVLSTGGFCIGTSCVTQWDDLKTMLGTGGSSSNLTITTTSIPDATVGVPYTFTFASTGGTGTFIWNLDPYNSYADLGGLAWSNADSSGRPNGLGIIRGTPTTVGTYKFTVTVNNSVSKEFTLVVKRAH